MSQSYDYRKIWVTESEVQELHEALGVAIETGDISGLPRAREIASLILSDITKTDFTSEDDNASTWECGHPRKTGEVGDDVCDNCFESAHPDHIAADKRRCSVDGIG